MVRDEITIDGNELLTAIRLRVRMPRLFGLRLWLTTRLFGLAELVSGMTVVVEVNDDDDELQDEVDAIDDDVGLVEAAIRQGARPTTHRFRP